MKEKIKGIFILACWILVVVWLVVHFIDDRKRIDLPEEIQACEEGDKLKVDSVSNNTIYISFDNQK